VDVRERDTPDHLIGFTPTTFAMYPRDERVVPITVRVDGRTHRP
jgi:hypothetical protein